MIDDFLAENAGHLTEVEAAVRVAAATEIMPRYRRLATHEIVEKSGPYDLVTVADRLAEQHLTASLTRLLPGSLVVGEEAVYADPKVSEALDGDAPVWIVDPVDGTRQFVQGEPGFCTLVALAQHGQVLASWTYAAALGKMAVAVRGRGATLNGEPLHSGSPAPGAVLKVAMSRPEYTSDAQRRALLGLRTEGFDARGCGSAGLEYLAVASGAQDAVAFNWEYPWDHAAGLVLVTEAGGAQSTLSGAPFRIAGGNDLPFTAARDEATAQRILTALRTGA